MATIKQEPGTVHIKAEPTDSPTHIKTEGGASDDEYEDAGDLDMTDGKRALWLVKLPKWLLEKWESIDDDEEITLGEVMVSPAEKFKLSLNKDLELHQDLPLLYDMELTNRSVSNTWVFTEKDMPGYDKDKKIQVVQDPTKPPMPQRLLQGDRDKRSFAERQKGQWNKNQKRDPYQRKPVLKKTALLGTVVHEAVVIAPENDPKYKQLMLEAHRKANQPKKMIEVLSGPVGGNLLAPGTLGAATGNFDSFIKRTDPAKKPQENKAARMEKSLLLDALFGCFKEYTAWSIKGLKEKLQQPEAYLKEVLNEIATLHKSGKFALKYTLKPEYIQRNPEEIKAALEADAAANGGTNSHDAIEIDDDDDDDEEVEMEDVL